VLSLNVGNKAKSHRAFKHFWFFSNTHSQHKKPKKLKFLPPLKKNIDFKNKTVYHMTNLNRLKTKKQTHQFNTNGFVNT